MRDTATVWYPPVGTALDHGGAVTHDDRGRAGVPLVSSLFVGRKSHRNVPVFVVETRIENQPRHHYAFQVSWVGVAIGERGVGARRGELGVVKGTVGRGPTVHGDGLEDVGQGWRGGREH